LTAEGCLSSYIDQQLIPGKLYYGFGDNEGLISTIPAICTALMGSLAGLWLRSNRPGNKKAAGLAAAGLACVVVGYLWGFVFPIIKIIWTSSYTLFSGGFCLMLLALFYWIIDVKGYRKWTIFFVVIGVNPITIYFLQRFVDFNGITEFFLSGLVANAGQLAPLIIPVGVLAIKWLLLWFLYRHKIFYLRDAYRRNNCIGQLPLLSGLLDTSTGARDGKCDCCRTDRNGYILPPANHGRLLHRCNIAAGGRQNVQEIIACFRLGRRDLDPALGSWPGIA